LTELLASFTDSRVTGSGLGVLAAVGRVGNYAARLVPLALKAPRYDREAWRHARETAIRGWLPACVIVGSFGAVTALQGLNIFRIFGTQTMLPSLIVVAILREAAPTFSGITLAAQAGSTVAAELAVMRVKEELDATEVMSVDALRFHVIPRIAGLLFTSPLLTALSAASGILAAWIVTVGFGWVSPGAFRENMFGFLTATDLLAGFAKSICYGLIIGVIATYQGYHATRGSRGVGLAANRAVVISIVCIVIVNYFLTSFFFGAASS
jgi:phospholipid/cholesterol/gamma-HCH transport system permease protein